MLDPNFAFLYIGYHLSLLERCSGYPLVIR